MKVTKPVGNKVVKKSKGMSLPVVDNVVDGVIHGIDAIEQKKKEMGQGGGKFPFFSLDYGDSVKIRICATDESHFIMALRHNYVGNVKGARRAFTCLKSGLAPKDARGVDCSNCENESNVRNEIFLPIYNYENDQIEILNEGIVTAGMLSSFFKKYKAKGEAGLIERDFEFTRNPKGSKIPYEIMPDDKSELDPEIAALINESFENAIAYINKVIEKWDNSDIEAWLAGEEVDRRKAADKNVTKQKGEDEDEGDDEGQEESEDTDEIEIDLDSMSLKELRQFIVDQGLEIEVKGKDADQLREEIQEAMGEEGEEAEEEEEESEEGEESEDDETEEIDLDELDRKGLIHFIKDNNLDIEIKGVSDDDLREAITSLMGKEDDEIDNSQYCPNCSTKVQEGQKKCKKCGEILDFEEEEEL